MATHAAGRLIERFRRAAEPEPSDAGLVEAYRVDRDEAAFAALVRRHGSMVLGVCRRVLRNEADAHDAFQATFLVLVRKAGSLRDPGRVANWLYGVAYRTATKARAIARRRREVELSSGGRESADHAPRSPEQDDLTSMLDAELAGLPAVYRQVIVLCDLQGRTIKGAAGELGWPVGTAATRLTRGRARLAQRLLARGVGPTTAAVAAGVPAALVTTTVQAATAFAAGAAGEVPAAAQLAEGVLRTMTFNERTVWAAVLVAVGVVAAGVGRLALPARAENPPPAAPPALAAGKADPAAVPLVKSLETRTWYHRRVDVKQRTIEVSDLPWDAIVDEKDYPNAILFITSNHGRLLLKGLSVAPDAAVTIDGKAGRLDDLASARELRLTFAADGATVTAIRATGRRPVPAPVLTAIDPNRGTIHVRPGEDGRPTELPVSPRARIGVTAADGRTERPRDKADRPTLADLSAGMWVRVVVGVEGGRLVVTEIEAWK